jgi:hypothetical protein
MAELKVEGNDVVVRLSAVEALAACRRQVRVPVTCLTMVHVEESALAGVSLLRLPGIGWPGAFVFGSRRKGGRHEFVAVRAGLPAVVLEADGTVWERVVVSHRDAINIAAELATLLLGRGPSNRGHGGDHGNGDGGKRRRARESGPSGLTLERAGVRARAGKPARAGAAARSRAQARGRAAQSGGRAAQGGGRTPAGAGAGANA